MTAYSLIQSLKMAWIFGGNKKTEQEVLEEKLVTLKKAAKELERKIGSFKKEEAKMTLEMKKLETQGDWVSCCFQLMLITLVVCSVSTTSQVERSRVLKCEPWWCGVKIILH